MPLSLLSGRSCSCFSVLLFFSCQVLLFRETLQNQHCTSIPIGIVPTGGFAQCIGAGKLPLTFAFPIFDLFVPFVHCWFLFLISDVDNSGFNGNLTCNNQDGVKSLTYSWQFDYQPSSLYLYYNCTLSNGSIIVRRERECVCVLLFFVFWIGTYMYITDTLYCAKIFWF